MKDTATKKSALIYAHGGGAVLCTAYGEQPRMVRHALECDCQVFNVDYDLAPGCKPPANFDQFRAVVKYVHANADKFNVDATKIVTAGDSGGGYICLGAQYLMAQANEDLVKVCILRCSMLSNELLHIP